MDLELAAVAGACIDLTNRKRSTQPQAGRAVHLRRKLGHRGIVPERCRLGKRSVHEALEEHSTHSRSTYRSWPE